MNKLKYWIMSLALVGLVFSVNTVYAKGQYSRGASDTEVRLGHTVPYSGPVSAYGTIGKVTQAYFDMLNAEEGGINGRQVKLFSLDDAYSPPKTKEQFRRLVEKEKVLLIFGALGTPTNLAVVRYINKKKVPHLFINTGASYWDQPKKHPWTMGFQPTYFTEGEIYANHILKNHPTGKVAVLYQNDDFGRDYFNGFKKAMGSKYKSMVVATEGYETASPTIDSEIIKLKSSGADIFVNMSTPKFGAQAIRKIYELNWKPVHYITNTAASVSAVFKPVGFEKCQGIMSAQYLMDPTDPNYKNAPGIIKWRKFMKKYYPDGDLDDFLNVNGYTNARMIEIVIRRAGDNLTRENILKQAESMKDIQLDTIIDGIKINTSPTDHRPFESMQLIQFKGSGFVPLGSVIKAGNDAK